MTKFSIIIPFLDNDSVRKFYLSRCLDSLLNQKFRDFEIIIVGTDLGFNSATDIKVLNLVYNQPLELPKMMNYAINKAEGEYFQFLQSDFIIYPSHFKFLDFYTNQFGNKILYTGNIIDIRSDETRHKKIDIMSPLYHHYDADHLDACIHRNQFERFYEGFTGVYTHWYVEWLARMWKKLQFFAFENLDMVHLPHGGKEEQKRIEGFLSNELYQKCLGLNLDTTQYSKLTTTANEYKRAIFELHGVK